MLKSNLNKSVRKDRKNPHYSSHGIPEDIIRNLQNIIKNPAIVVLSDNRISILSDELVDTEAGKAPLMIGIDPNSSVYGKPANEIKSIYGREGVVIWLKLRAKDSSIIIGDEKKASTLLRDAGIETSGPVANAGDLVDEILSNDEKAVKPKSSIDTDAIGNEDAESLRRRNAELEKRVAALRAETVQTKGADGKTIAERWKKDSGRIAA